MSFRTVFSTDEYPQHIVLNKYDDGSYSLTHGDEITTHPDSGSAGAALGAAIMRCVAVMETIEDIRRLHTTKMAEEFTQAGVDETALDDLVHETTQAESLDELNSTDDPARQEAIIASSEGYGSEINNGGFEDQIAYLLSQGVTEETIRHAAS